MTTIQTIKGLHIPIEKQTKISFDPIPHKYYDDNGLVYTSVTTLISKYHKEFNKHYWSMYVALRDSGFQVRPDIPGNKFIVVNGIQRDIDDLYNNPINCIMVKGVVQEWQRLTIEACNRGNEIHDGLERDINESKGDTKGETNKEITPLYSLNGHLLEFKTKHDLEATGIQNRWPSIYLKLLEYINQGCTIYAEKRIYSTSFQIAGMIDVLIVKGKYFAILDWKTNKKKLLFESGYYKKVLTPEGIRVGTNQFIKTNDKLYPPLNHIDHCKGMIYTLQLNSYAYMMIRWGYKPVKNPLTICHIRPNEQPEFIPIKLMINDVEDMMLDHYKKNVINNKKEPSHFGIR